MRKLMFLFFLMCAQFQYAQESDPCTEKVRTEMNIYKQECKKMIAADSIATAKRIEIYHAELERMVASIKTNRIQQITLMVISFLLLLGNVFFYLKWKKK